jgi:hypothetical protein
MTDDKPDPTLGDAIAGVLADTLRTQGRPAMLAKAQLVLDLFGIEADVAELDRLVNAFPLMLSDFARGPLSDREIIDLLRARGAEERIIALIERDMQAATHTTHQR